MQEKSLQKVVHLELSKISYRNIFFFKELGVFIKRCLFIIGSFRLTVGSSGNTGCVGAG